MSTQEQAAKVHISKLQFILELQETQEDPVKSSAGFSFILQYCETVYIIQQQRE